jgi:hypothetical protein
MEIAQDVMDQRICPKTRQSYASSIKKFKKWLKSQNANVYLSREKEIILPVPNEEQIILTYLGSLKNTNKKGIVDKDYLIAKSTMMGHISAIQNLYKENNIELGKTTKLKISSFIRGYNRIVSEAKQQGKMKVFEGKKNISFTGYCALAEYVLRKGDTDGELYIHLFIVMSWNLFARSHSVATLMLHHFEWQDDCLLVTLPKHKGDQEGTTVLPKHVYANPQNPWTCPILSLAIYTFSTNLFHRENTDWMLFRGSRTESKFSNWLQKQLKRTSSEVQALIDGSAEDIGTHSFRKGVVTFVLSFPGGPSVIVAYLRACWSLGQVQHRYIFEGEGGADQFLGRVAAGLALDEIEFTALPPRFRPDHFISAEKWKEIYPNYEEVPKCFRGVLPYLLASLVHHKEFLTTHLPNRHPLFRSTAWTSGLIAELQPFVLSGFQQCELTHMKATGIPPFITQKAEILRLKNLVTTITSLVNSRSDQIESALKNFAESLPHEVAVSVNKNFIIQGSQPLTQMQLENHLNSFKTSMTEELRGELRVGINDISERMQPPASSAGTNGIIPESFRYQLFYWGGEYRFVPESFKLHTMSIQQLWCYWHYGDPLKKIAPYKNLRSEDCGTDRRFTKASKVMKIVERLGRSSTNNGSIPINSSTVEIGNLIFKAGLQGLIMRIENKKRELNKPVFNSRRFGEIKFTTQYNDNKYVK